MKTLQKPSTLSKKTLEKPTTFSKHKSQKAIHTTAPPVEGKAIRTTAPPVEGIVDSGATAHFLPMSYKGTNKQNARKGEGITVRVANGGTMESIVTDELDLPLLPKEATECVKFVK